MDILDAARITVPGATVRVLERCTSTNALLVAAAPLQPELLVAEEQTAGRGRHGRRWHSARGAALTLSLGRRMRRSIRELGGLPLAAGVAVARALRALGAREVALKWPNDLVARHAKLGGILIETRIRDGSVLAVIGVGLNWRATPGLAGRLRRRVAALEQLVPALPARNIVAERIGVELLESLAAFDAVGFAGVREQWEALHAYRDRRIRVRLDDGRILSGIPAGVTLDGALRLRSGTAEHTLRAGHVLSARPA